MSASQFAGWALQKGLNLEGGEDDDTLISHHVTSDHELARVRKEKHAARKAKKAKPAPAAFQIPSWVELAQKLPAGNSDKDATARKILFNTFDPNGNGYLSLAEVDKGLIVKFQLVGGDEFATKRCKPAINRAFHAAKGINGDGGTGGDYVTKQEFRLLLVYLQRYFELLAVFDEVDTSDDRRVDATEFQKALPKLAEWGVKVADPAAEFAAIDENGGGHGTVRDGRALAPRSRSVLTHLRVRLARQFSLMSLRAGHCKRASICCRTASTSLRQRSRPTI